MNQAGIPSRLAALAAAVVVAVTAAGCSEDKKSDGTGGGKAVNPATTAYTDQLLAHLRTTSQGVHALKAEVVEEKGDLIVHVDTDLPYFPDEDTSDPAQDAHDRLDKLAAEAEDWAADKPGEPEVDLIAIHPVGHRDVQAAEIAFVPTRNEEHGKRAAYADRLLAHLKATATGVGVTRAELAVIVGHVEVIVTSDLPSHTAADYSTAEARQARDAAETLAQAVVAWTAANPEYKVTSVVVEDREKSNLTVVPV
ncbi:hypothetical protein [Yinghuangia sp. YIM S09857]|uniref:hypothetical protein n=1 Tax=Yinghuangia sp. YIM S09857 TaxID=3436929 RepID=UPI003F53926F